MPCLELCAALTGAQLTKLLQTEITATVEEVVMWTDSTTVLSWIKSDSCRFKVFVGTRIAEIQDLTDPQAWRYVTSVENPANDLTRGKSLQDIAGESQWACGPAFLRSPPDQWPQNIIPSSIDNPDELRTTACLLTQVASSPDLPDAQQFDSFAELLTETAKRLHGAAADPGGSPTVENFKEAELSLLRAAQLECFPEEVDCLMTGKGIPSSSRLLTLAPEMDKSLQLIRVGGRLRRCSEEVDTIHPMVLDPKHPVTRLLIQQTDRD